jgi:hypothetical protein
MTTFLSKSRMTLATLLPCSTLTGMDSDLHPAFRRLHPKIETVLSLT